MISLASLICYRLVDSLKIWSKKTWGFVETNFSIFYYYRYFAVKIIGDDSRN